LPKTDAKSLPSESEPITITVDKDGKVFLQETEVSLDDIVTRLTAIAQNGYVFIYAVIMRLIMAQ